MPHHHNSFIISKLIIITLFHLLSFPNNVTCSINPHYVHHECTRSGTNSSYSSGSEFEANLNTTLLNILSANSALLGFSKQTTGEGSDQLHTVFYCQGDIIGQDCRDCYKAAGRNILEKCHLLKEAIIWYDECTLHYSGNKDVILSTEEVSPSPSHGSYNFSNVLKNLDQEKSTFEKLMNGLILEASENSNNDDDERRIEGYATGEAPLSSLTLRGAVQCRPDLVSRACDTCLRSALKQMDGWSTTMVFLPSCNLRFDLYPSLIGGPPTSSGNVGGSVPKKVIIPVVVVGSVVLLCSIACLVLFFKRKSQQRNKPPVDGEVHQVVDAEPRNVESRADPPPTPAHATGEPSNVKSRANPPSTRVPPTVFQGNMRPRTSQPTAQIPFWSAHQSPEPSAPPIPKGHVNQQRL